MASITRTANPNGVSASSNVATYSTQSIGTAASNRWIVVGVISELSSSTPSGCTIDSGSGDTAMTAGTGGNFGAVYAQTYRLLVPTGTTATIKVTYSATNPTSTQNRIVVYSILDGAYSSAGGDGSTDMDATDPLTTGSITIPTGGVFLAVAGGATDTVAKTWANATEDLDVDAGAFRFTTATRATALTTTAVTCTGGTNGEDGALSYLIFTDNTEPTVSLNTPADSATGQSLTPTLNFTGTDSDSDAVEYQVQVDTSNTFNSQTAATIGYTSNGASSLGPSQNKFFGTRFTSPSTAANVTGGQIAICSDLGSGKTAKVVIVKQVDLSIVTNGVSDAISVPYQAGDSTPNSFTSFTFASTPVLEPQTDYVLGVIHNDTDFSIYVSYDAGTANYYYFDSTNDYTTPTNPTDAVTTGDDNAGPNNAKISAYLTLATPLIGAASTTDAGFTAGHPFASGVAKDYTAYKSLAFDATSNSGFQATTSNYSWNHTCTGTDLVLVVGVTAEENTNNANLPVTGVTYNGVAMTKANEQNTNGGGSADLASQWYLISPDTGTHSISVTHTGTVSASVGGAVSYTNANQTTQPDVAGVGNKELTGTGTASVSITPTTAGCVIVDNIIGSGSTNALTEDASQTERWNVTATGNFVGAGSTFQQTSAGAKTMQWTFTSQVWAINALAIRPAIYSLTASTTYYWRARAIDPSGSNTYGAWATTRSFTTGGGGSSSQSPSNSPSLSPSSSISPSTSPSVSPSVSPSLSPSSSISPSQSPSNSPSLSPSSSVSPSRSPSNSPSLSPSSSISPSNSPSISPSLSPSSSISPSRSPSNSPSVSPSVSPSISPSSSISPSVSPSVSPSLSPSSSISPSVSPSVSPSLSPSSSISPSVSPSVSPSMSPSSSISPSRSPSSSPSLSPSSSISPSRSPSNSPSISPSSSVSLSISPSASNSPSPSAGSSSQSPSNSPSLSPSSSISPSLSPSISPSTSQSPSSSPSISPSASPSLSPSASASPSLAPTETIDLISFGIISFYR